MCVCVLEARGGFYARKALQRRAGSRGALVLLKVACVEVSAAVGAELGAGADWVAPAPQSLSMMASWTAESRLLGDSEVVVEVR
jgi:hypothetical protein